jgi:CBS domain containing-hemolysin-like protein
MITVDFLAVLVATILAFAVGALWYSVLFGKQWRELMGFTDEVMKSMKMTPAKGLAGGFLTTLVMVFVLANLMAMTYTESIGAALTLAFWIWIGFVATIMSNLMWYENKPVKLYLINASHYLVAILLAALVLAWWPF